MNRLKHCMRTLVIVCSLFAALPAGAAPRANPIPGGIAILPLAPASEPAPQAFFGERPVLVARTGAQWQAIVGIPLATEPGAQSLRVVAAGAGGVQERELAFTVKPHAYPTQHITIADPDKANPPPEAMARIEREQKQIEGLRTRFSDAAEAQIDFALPAKGRLSGRFGARRVINGEPRNPHTGLDLAIGAGTPLQAPAAGTVIDTSDYFFCGQAVFLDHGQGLISLYCHMQRVDVKLGERVARGQALGLSGKSGRATGPHLHWSIYLNGTAIDPELMIPPQR